MIKPYVLRPLIVAHEANSYRKIKRYITAADIIEIDVIKSRGDTIVLKHISDDELLRNLRDSIINKSHSEYRKGYGNILSRIAGKIRFFKPGKWEYRLEDALRYISNLGLKENRSIGVMIDLKVKGIADKVAKIINSIEFNGTVYVSSRYHRELVRIKHLAPQAKALASFSSEPINLAEYIHKAGLDGVSVHAAYVDKDIIDELHSYKYIVAVWTVNDPMLALYLTSLKVDMIITDIPETIGRIIEQSRIP